MDKDEKQLTIGFAYKLGMVYVRKAVFDSKGDKDKIERNQERFFDVCDQAKKDLVLASVVPKERVLILFQEINKERLYLLKTIFDLERLCPNNNITSRLQSWVNLLVQSCTTLISCYEQNKSPPKFLRETITIPKLNINESIPEGICKLKVYGFKSNSHNNEKVQYKIRIKDIQDKVVLDEYITPTSQFNTEFTNIISSNNKLLRSKGTIEIIEIEKKFLSEKQKSLGTQHFPLSLLANTNRISNQFNIKKCSITIDAEVRQQLNGQPIIDEDFEIRYIINEDS